jgi:hypothetical protein
MAAERRRHPVRDEDGFALVLGLGAAIMLAIVGTAVVQYTTMNSRSAVSSREQIGAEAIAEAGLQAAYSVLNYWDDASNTGNNAAGSTLLGSSASPRCVPVYTACPSPTSVGTAGTAAYYGSYDSTNARWTIVASGYARNSTGTGLLVKRKTALVQITTTDNAAANVAVWNHVYSTAPQGSGCELDLSGTNVIVDVPVYVTGDLCMSGTNASVQEVTGGQAVDLRVVGKLVFSGNNAKVGTDATHPITSGAVGGGCTTTINGATQPCASPPFNWYVRTPQTLQTLTPPTVDPSWYLNADPGPRHPCRAGTNPAPLSPSTFDNDVTANVSAGTFNMTPSFSYTCLSQTGTGQLSWNDTTNVLTISGVVYVDGNVQITQTGTYTGRGSVYAGGTVTLVGTNTTFCATAGCDFNTWDPNTTMLMLIGLGSGNAISFSGTNNKWQGSLFTNPTSTVQLAGTNVEIQGPVVGGKFGWGTNTKIRPLPTINNLPPGAPLAVNAHATPGPLVLLSG